MAAGCSASTETVRELVAALASLAPALDDHDRIERVRLFEELKAVAAAAMAVETRDFEVSQRARQAIDGVPVKQQGRGIAGQIGLARRISPWAASRYLGWAKILPDELPQTFALLRAGRITEWRATLIARETIWLSRQDRAIVDHELAPHLESWGDRQVEAETKRIAYRLDPEGYLARVRGAENDRRVTLRPAPDTMTRLTALLPVAQGVAAYAALCKTADTTTAGGDHRGRGQLMADTLVERLTGQATADAVPVEIELIMTDRTLLGDAHPDTPPGTTGRGDAHSDAHSDGVGDAVGANDDAGDEDAAPHDDGRDEPAHLIGYGPLPAALARHIALEAHGDKWLRRVFLSPTSGQLAAIDTTSRCFTSNERLFVRLRDHTCRTPWCDAAIRHTDHLIPYGQGGRTHTDNAAGACEACNYAKEAAGWTTQPAPDGSIVTTTPTGHHYLNRQPAPPGSGPPGPGADERLAGLRDRGRLAA